jgi:excisionase family DNA binding protein
MSTSSSTDASAALTCTLREVASLCRVSYKTIQKWNAAGQIPGRVVGPGFHPKFSREAIYRWLRGEQEVSRA